MGDSGRQTILVVENDDALRQMMVSSLGDPGFVTLEAASGGEALTVFRAQQAGIDLAIIELEIPTMSGLDLAAELERMQPGINILYMSSLHESIAMNSIGQRSPERVLLKPFDPEVLRERALRLLANASPVRPRRLRKAQRRQTAGSSD